MNAITVRGNQDDKALAAYVQWKNGKALVGTTYLPMQPSLMLQHSYLHL